MQQIFQEAVSKHPALWPPLLEKSQHIHEWLGDSAQHSGLTLKLQIARGSKLEQIGNAPAFLFAEKRRAVKIIRRLNGHAKPEWLFREGLSETVSCWHRLPPPAPLALGKAMLSASIAAHGCDSLDEPVWHQQG